MIKNGYIVKGNLFLNSLDERINGLVSFAWDFKLHHVDSEGERRWVCVPCSGD
jgi:hypothetical protein